MSVPHTGTLGLLSKGSFSFDGNRWVSVSEDLARLLNVATDNSPKIHFGIRELVGHVFRQLSLDGKARILSWQPDVWPDAPPEADGVD